LHKKNVNTFILYIYSTFYFFVFIFFFNYHSTYHYHYHIYYITYNYKKKNVIWTTILCDNFYDKQNLQENVGLSTKTKTIKREYANMMWVLEKKLSQNNCSNIISPKNIYNITHSNFYVKSLQGRVCIVLRPSAMSLLKAIFNILNHCNGVVENDGKMMWRKEVMKQINMLKVWPNCHASRFYWPKQAREIHAPQGEWVDRERGERKRIG